MTLRFIDAQFFATLAWALRDHATIVSGAYKLRKTQQGREPTEEEKEKGHCIGWRDQTDEEKLRDAMGTLTQRCHWLNELAETIYEVNKEEEDQQDTSDEGHKEFREALQKYGKETLSGHPFR